MMRNLYEWTSWVPLLNLMWYIWCCCYFRHCFGVALVLTKDISNLKMTDCNCGVQIELVTWVDTPLGKGCLKMVSLLLKPLELAYLHCLHLGKMCGAFWHELAVVMQILVQWTTRHVDWMQTNIGTCPLSWLTLGRAHMQRPLLYTSWLTLLQLSLPWQTWEHIQ